MVRKRDFDISIITQFYPPDCAATGQLIQELATELGKQGSNIHIFTGQPGYAINKATAPALEDAYPLMIKRTRISRLWSKNIAGKALSGILFCLRSLIHLFDSYWRGDVLLITTTPPFLYILGYLANLFFALPYVCLIYDLYPDAAVELKVVSENNLLVKLWDVFNRIVWQRAQSIIVLSSTMKERIVAKHPHLANKIVVIHSWANPHEIQPISKQENWFASQHQLTNKFTVLYSGTLGRCHDVDTILNAAKLLQDEQIQFVFIGGGAKWSACVEKVKELGLNNFLFLPYQDKQVIPYSLTACDLSLVSIAPGLEGIVAPSKLYGILAAGRPVAAICEPHSYLRDLLADAGCGEAFDNNDALALAEFIRSLASNPMQGDRMGKAARTYLESHFTPEIIAEQYAQVLTPQKKVSQRNNYTPVLN
jgi:glycosyltransferase involved in cell wall biosynthesis